MKALGAAPRILCRGAREGRGMSEQSSQGITVWGTDLRSEADRCRYYQELFELAPEGYLVTNSDGIIQEANRAATMLLGTAREAPVGRALTDFVAESEREAFCAEI